MVFSNILPQNYLLIFTKLTRSVALYLFSLPQYVLMISKVFIFSTKMKKTCKTGPGLHENENRVKQGSGLHQREHRISQGPGLHVNEKRIRQGPVLHGHQKCLNRRSGCNQREKCISFEFILVSTCIYSEDVLFCEILTPLQAMQSAYSKLQRHGLIIINFINTIQFVRFPLSIQLLRWTHLCLVNTFRAAHKEAIFNRLIKSQANFFEKQAA